jgi:hypothetical protein
MAGALLDVSEVLSDPDFCEKVTVRRRQQALDEHGRDYAIETNYLNVSMVITAGSPNDLQRPEDYESFLRSITVVTKFRLRGQVKDFLPDVVVWRGNNFVVDALDPYPQFGNGFYQGYCTSMDREDNAFDLVLTGQMVYNNALNTSTLSIIN